MKVIAVDDEQLALNALEVKLREFPEFSQIDTFRDPQRAVEYVRDNGADIAFLDIHMKQMNGLWLAKRVKELSPGCAIVFVTGYSEYAIQAFALHVSGYLMKPVRTEHLRRELNYILTPPPRPKSANICIKAQCFGNFEVFAGDKLMKFQYAKTKEMFAYLIDRKGAWCSNGEIISVLWEGQINLMRRSSHFRDLRCDLITALKEADCENVIQKNRGMMAVRTDTIVCDYYDWLRGQSYAVNAYMGEYMTQYSWGEITLGGIETTIKNNLSPYWGRSNKDITEGNRQSHAAEQKSAAWLHQ